MLETASRILFLVSSSMLIPVILALLLSAGWMVMVLGGMLREAAARRSLHRPLSAALRALERGDRAGARRQMPGLTAAPTAIGFVPRYLSACWREDVDPPVAGKVVDQIEIEMSRRISSLSAIARLGPMLGLAGTLIPLGPGLVNLAGGDLAGLANHLVIAFSTTVVGLLVGMAAFLCADIRRGWYARDLNAVVFLEAVRTEVFEEVSV